MQCDNIDMALSKKTISAIVYAAVTCLTLLVAYLVDDSMGLWFFLLFVLLLIIGICILLVNGLSNVFFNFMVGFRNWWHHKQM